MKGENNSRTIDPTVWGPSAWELLHALSFCRLATLRNGKKMFQALQVILPCPKCRDSLKDHVEEHAFPVRRSEWSRWVYNLHTRVNSAKQFSNAPTFRKVRQKWRHAFSKCCRFSKLNVWKFLFALSQTHPGKTSASTVYVRATLDFWECIQATLSTHVDCFSDHEEITRYFEERPIKASLNTKSDYMKWMMEFHVALTNEPFNMKKEMPGSSCSSTCKA